MERKDFLRYMAILPLTGSILGYHKLARASQAFSNTGKMPALFLGHGSPMNAIEDNEFVRGFRNIAEEIEKPNAILCISAHWETKGTKVTAMPHPRTIHDFGGFPKELFDVQYPAPGSPSLAAQTKEIITSTDVQLDDKWGLDHGAWTVIKHMYPNADIPVIQMSLDYTKPPQYHYELAQELAQLRRKGVLIVGSGNMVHNLRKVDFSKIHEDDYAFDWAREANEKMKTYITTDNHQPLINYQSQGKAFKMAIPTPEHYLPLLYTLGLKESQDEVSIFNDKALAGSLTMTSIKLS